MTTSNWNLNIKGSLKATALLKNAVLLCASVSLFSACTKGSTISGSAATSVAGSITLSKVYPSADGDSWNAIHGIAADSNRYYIHGLSLTVTGTCTRGIDKIKVHEGSSSDYAEQATCSSDGTWIWRRVYAATSEEGDKTLTFTAYDISNALISGSVANVDVRVDATGPTGLAIYDPTVPENNGSIDTYPIMGHCSLDTVKIIGPAGALIIPTPHALGTCTSCQDWTYTAQLVSGASLNYSFTSYDLAGNPSSNALTQTIQWFPAVGAIAGGAFPGGQAADSSSGSLPMRLEASVNISSDKVHDSSTFTDFINGFNYVINKVRGL